MKPHHKSAIPVRRRGTAGAEVPVVFRIQLQAKVGRGGLAQDIRLGLARKF